MKTKTKKQKAQSLMIKTLFAAANLAGIGILFLLYLYGLYIWEVFLALCLVQMLFSGYFFGKYLMYKAYQKIAHNLGFDLITTGFLEQARMEGNYRDNWFQIHYASRPYGEYWGVPRTYVKLQYKTKLSFDKNILDKKAPYVLGDLKIDSLVYIDSNYKNYLLIKVTFFSLRI